MPLMRQEKSLRLPLISMSSLNNYDTTVSMCQAKCCCPTVASLLVASVSSSGANLCSTSSANAKHFRIFSASMKAQTRVLSFTLGSSRCSLQSLHLCLSAHIQLRTLSVKSSNALSHSLHVCSSFWMRCMPQAPLGACGRDGGIGEEGVQGENGGVRNTGES